MKALFRASRRPLPRVAAPVRPPWRHLGLAALAGVIMATGQAPLGWWWCTLPALALLMNRIAGAGSLRAALWLGWIGGGGYFAAALIWLVEPFLVEPEVYGWMAPFALALMALGLALFWAAATGAAWALGRTPRARVLALAVTLAGAELARGYVLTGFPWALIGHIWIATPVAQAAALVGPVGLTLATTLVCAAALAWPRAGGAAALAALVAVWGAGAWRLARPMPPDRAVTVRLVQPNATQRLKNDPDMMHLFVQRQLDLTAAPPAPGAPVPDLTIWPESAIPWLVDDVPDLLALIAGAAGGRPVAFGAQRVRDGRYFNSLVVLDGAGRMAQIYDKHHLVPFGEYFPGGDIAARLGLHGFAMGEGDGFSPGPGPRLLDLPGGRALALICYEVVFPQDMRGTERPDWMVQVTNDGWFGALVGPYQHLAQARLRAVEQGLPLLRVANTGVSAVIDARGRVVRALALDTQGIIDAPLPGALPPTPYSRTGDGPVAVLILIGLAGLGVRRFRH